MRTAPRYDTFRIDAEGVTVIDLGYATVTTFSYGPNHGTAISNNDEPDVILLNNRPVIITEIGADIARQLMTIANLSTLAPEAQ